MIRTSDCHNVNTCILGVPENDQSFGHFQQFLITYQESLHCSIPRSHSLFENETVWMKVGHTLPGITCTHFQVWHAHMQTISISGCEPFQESTRGKVHCLLRSILLICFFLSRSGIVYISFTHTHSSSQHTVDWENFADKIISQSRPTAKI